MPDIFGRNPEDYAVVRQMSDDGSWERYQADNAERRPDAQPLHDFNALSAGPPQRYERAAEDAQALGYLTNSQLAIQTMVDEVMYTAFRLPDFVELDMSVPEGALSWGPRVMDRTGKAKRVATSGDDVPTATVSRTLVPKPVHYYGLDAIWTIEEIRGAMMSGTPLDTESIEAAVMGSPPCVRSLNIPPRLRLLLWGMAMTILPVRASYSAR